MSAYTAENWPITSCMLGLDTTTRNGTPAQVAGPEFWKKQLAKIANQGFTNVELSDAWLKPALLSSGERAELVSIAAELGMKIPSVHIQRVSVIEPGKEAENLAYQHASIDAAAEMGISVYSTGLHQPFNKAQRDALWFWNGQGPIDPVGDTEVWNTAVTRIRELARHAQDLGMITSLEMYEDTYIGSSDSAVRFVEDVGTDLVGINPDVGNLVRLHREVEDWRETYAKTLPYANYWHLKNYTRDEAADHSYYATAPSTLRDGVINYREVVELAVSLGYSGILTCEHYGGDSISVCGENQRHLRGLLAETLAS
ncbi:sugar phosphate isomerase/epimerase [Salinibacterium amurskyense]|uniref:Sugar phosphate isomerase/epimerase n=1 Tax=Salinibacterium amurskyense TaxID=205941 RepID=A0A2M9DAT7_9MICO|nr:sugar phosphate isomerase/epimerase family protein [Salinibacterium amurskyense]PJJ82593.1 sugar phosphate isomerase/epimerase [Salinibacterium amurskyense]GHD76385.1 xylose isomerase [Salinibacterium amurskyense]